MIKSISAGLSSKLRDSKPVLLSLLLLSALSLSSCESPPPESPGVDNVVLIGIDTVGAKAFFSENIQDALSARLSSAQQYHNASAVAPWTIPSVASTLTGVYPVQHNAGQFEHQPANLDVDLPSALDESAITLADRLNEHQFQTGIFSAHPWINAKFGLAQGFNQLHSRKGWKKVTTRFYEWLDKPPRPKQQSKDGQPQRFFAYLHFMEAHDWHLKDRASRLARLEGIDPALRSLLLRDTTSAACVDENSNICLSNLVYNLAVRELRIALADIMQQLEDRDLLKNTLVMVYSDHGEEFWEHKVEHQQHTDPRGIYGFGHGQSLYEELLNVPLLAWHPQIEGTSRQDLVSLIDIAPSILSWLGVEQSGESLPGIQLPAGSDPIREENDQRIIYASGIAYGPEAIATREGPLKSIMRYPEESFEYFDLGSDPEEKHPTMSDLLTMRFDVLTGDYVDMKNESLAYRPELDAQTLEHLKSIGYLQGVEEQPDAKKAPAKKADETSSKPDSEDSPES